MTILPQLPGRSHLSARLSELRDRLQEHDERSSIALFAPVGFDRVLKTTISLCPHCLDHVPALVFTRGERVMIRKICEAHGHCEALLESDVAFYRLSSKDQWGRRFADDLLIDFPSYGGCCGGNGCCDPEPKPLDGSADFINQWSNKSCTVLVEVTNACNLACAVCYSDARGDRILPLELFKKHMRELIARKNGLDSVQLTGGEALLHPQFDEMLRFLYESEGIKRIYLPTNGILLAKREAATTLLPYKSKLMVLLQFDGKERDANVALRNAHPVSARQRALDNLSRLGICMQLTMTVARGVNEEETGWVVDTALSRSNVKLAALQPVTYSGRYDLPPDPLDRLTLSDVAKAVTRQASRRVSEDQFVPIPCSHPNCGWITLFVRRLGITMNIVRHIDLSRAMNETAYKTVLSTTEIRDIIGTPTQSLPRRVAGALGRRLIRARDAVAIAIKPFMDRFNYDLDRVSACCHHTTDTRGVPISFCEYNARLRPHDSWDNFPKLEA